MDENDVTTRERLSRVEEKLDFLLNDIKKLDSKVEALEQKPVKKWDGIITALLAAVGGGIGGTILSKLIGG
jgi:hypothetical protein